MSGDLPTYRRRANRLVLDYKRAKAQTKAERAAVGSLRAKTASLLEAQALAQAVAQQIQNQAHESIAKIVTQCLAIFEDDNGPITFHIRFDRARGKTEARLVFEQEGQEIDPLSASGGGIVDVAAFALRVACLLLTKPAPARTLVLDEPFRFVSEGYVGRVRGMLESLAAELDLQFIIVTHDKALRAGTIIDLE